jgi:hypothetical protein
MLYEKIKKNIKANCYIYTLAFVLLVYGCSPSDREWSIDWDSINYKKIACADGGDEDLGCQNSNKPMSVLGSGKR